MEFIWRNILFRLNVNIVYTVLFCRKKHIIHFVIVYLYLAFSWTEVADLKLDHVKIVTNPNTNRNPSSTSVIGQDTHGTQSDTEELQTWICKPEIWDSHSSDSRTWFWPEIWDSSLRLKSDSQNRDSRHDIDLHSRDLRLDLDLCTKDWDSSQTESTEIWDSIWTPIPGTQGSAQTHTIETWGSHFSPSLSARDVKMSVLWWRLISKILCSPTAQVCVGVYIPACMCVCVCAHMPLFLSVTSPLSLLDLIGGCRLFPD